MGSLHFGCLHSWSGGTQCALQKRRSRKINDWSYVTVVQTYKTMSTRTALGSLSILPFAPYVDHNKITLREEVEILLSGCQVLCVLCMYLHALTDALEVTLPRTKFPELEVFLHRFLCRVPHCTHSFKRILSFLSDFGCFCFIISAWNAECFLLS